MVLRDNNFSILCIKEWNEAFPFTVDADVKNSERKAYVGSDNFSAGEQLGDVIIDNTSGGQFIGVITGRFDSISQQERIEGIEQAMASYPELEIVAVEESNLTELGAARATYTLLKEHPEITTLVGTSALDGVGVVEGLRDITPNRDIFTVVFEELPRTLKGMQIGDIDATIVQHP